MRKVFQLRRDTREEKVSDDVRRFGTGGFFCESPPIQFFRRIPFCATKKIGNF